MADDSSSSSSSGTGSRPFPVLIPVPRFSDVTSNFSEGDYGRWLALAGASGAMGAYVATPAMRTPMTLLATTLGGLGGFLIAYQNSSARLMGLKDNRADAKRLGL